MVDGKSDQSHHQWCHWCAIPVTAVSLISGATVCQKTEPVCGEGVHIRDTSMAFSDFVYVRTYVTVRTYGTVRLRPAIIILNYNESVRRSLVPRGTALAL